VNLDEGLSQMIRNLDIHKVPTRPMMLQCDEFIPWLISHANINNKLIRDVIGNIISSFQPYHLDIYYKFPNLTKEWYYNLPLTITIPLIIGGSIKKN